MDNGFLPKLKEFLSKYKYWIVLALFLLVILVASDNSLVIDRIARERYNMHREDEDLFIEE